LQNIKTFAKHAHVKIQNLTFTLQIYTNSEWCEFNPYFKSFMYFLGQCKWSLSYFKSFIYFLGWGKWWGCGWSFERFNSLHLGQKNRRT
jgi:hypothetical protein